MPAKAPANATNTSCKQAVSLACNCVLKSGISGTSLQQLKLSRTCPNKSTNGHKQVAWIHWQQTQANPQMGSGMLASSLPISHANGAIATKHKRHVQHPLFSGIQNCLESMSVHFLILFNRDDKAHGQALQVYRLTAVVGHLEPKVLMIYRASF